VAAEVDATRTDALLGLGTSLIHTGQPVEALEPLEKYLSLYPDHEQALFGKAVSLQQAGRHAEAVEEYRKVLKRNPRCEEALSNLVALFLEKKDNDSVRRYAEMLVRAAAGIHRGDGSAGHAGLRRRRLYGRGALLPQPLRTGARPFSKTGSTWAWRITN
jgi:Flp pilus assembly protein TadD